MNFKAENFGLTNPESKKIPQRVQAMRRGSKSTRQIRKSSANTPCNYSSNIQNLVLNEEKMLKFKTDKKETKIVASNSRLNDPILSQIFKNGASSTKSYQQKSTINIPNEVLRSKFSRGGSFKGENELLEYSEESRINPLFFNTTKNKKSKICVIQNTKEFLKLQNKSRSKKKKKKNLKKS